MVAASIMLAAVIGIQSAPTAGLRLFYGWRECLAAASGEFPAVRTRLIVLAADAHPEEVVIDKALPPVRAPRDCASLMRVERSHALAQVALPERLEDELVFGIAATSNVLVIGGPVSRLSRKEAERWVDAASPSLPAVWRSKNVLVHAYRYGRPDGPNAVELYLGRAKLNRPGAPPPIRSIAIRRVFIVAGRVLASEEYDRESGREERAETEPPALTFDNWSASETERTAAFVSADKGSSWTRLSTDGGFEGVWWIAQALAPGLPRTFEHFLYTHH